MNQNLFGTSRTSRIPTADTTNAAGGAAYSLPEWHQLCQLAMTGFFSSTFYDASDGQEQLNRMRELAPKFSPHQLYRLACVSRERGYMKDMPPALFLLAKKRDVAMSHRVFPRVADSDKPAKALFEMALGGKFDMRSLGSLKKDYENLLRNWSPEKLVALAIGTKPSIRDIFKMVHPVPRTLTERALWGYLLGNGVERWGGGASHEDLPSVIQALWQYDHATDPDTQLALLPYLNKIRWERLGGNARSDEVWKGLARNMKPQALRMNLNTLARHGVFNDPRMVDFVIAQLHDREAILRSRQFAYAYKTAYDTCDSSIVPDVVRSALNAAADIATGNVPMFSGPIVVLVDVSDSMNQAKVTGPRKNTTLATCVDVAALMGVSIWRKNQGSILLPVDTVVHDKLRLDPADAVLSLANRLSAIRGGGTALSVGLKHVNEQMRNRSFAGVVVISDNESWCDSVSSSQLTGLDYGYGSFSMSARREAGATALLTEFKGFQHNQRRIGAYPHPKMVCVNLCPNTTTQAKEGSDVLNVGGYSDIVFELIDMHLRNDRDRFTRYVDNYEL